MSLELNSFRSQVSFIDALPSLFLGTIRENLLLGNISATDQHLYEVLKVANADFVKKLHLDLSTVICDNN